MAGQDTGQILKYFMRIIMAVLLTCDCGIWNAYANAYSDFPETSNELKFSYIDGQLHHRRPRNTDLLEYFVVVEINVSQAVMIEQTKTSLAFIMLPFQMDNNTEITSANITTVCQPNESEYQCVCEDGYAWSYNNCKTYEACGDIGFGSCGCISHIPSDGEGCVLENELPFTDILSEIEVEATSISVIDEMKRYLQNITFPLQLDKVVEVLDVDISTVCNFTDSGYKCVCEDQYFWPCNKCKEYGSCDGITNNTCSCINDIPSDRQFCQRVNEITSDNITCAQPATVPPPTAPLTESPTQSVSTESLSTPTESSSSTATQSTFTLSPSTESTAMPSPSTQTPSTESSTSSAATKSTESPSTSMPSTPSKSTQSTSNPSTPSKSTQSTSNPSTPTPSTPTPSIEPSTTRTIVKTTVIGMSMKISQTYDISLTNQSSTPYNELSKRIESAINTSYSKKITGYEVGSAKVTGFRSGSVIADYTIIATSNSLDFVAANIEVSDSLSTQGLNVTKDDLILSAQKDLTTEPLYPLQKVVLNCTQTEFANGQIKWTVDDKDPALNKTRYLISPDNRTLTVINATEQDSGRYSCIIQGNVTYVQWQNIAIKKRPSINVGEKDHYIFCDGSSLQLKCSVDVGYNIEWILGEEVLMSGTDSITYNHKIKNVNCTEEIFTCRLRDLPQLQDYGYSQSRVTVKISTANALSDDVCHTQELGAGKTNDVRTGVCGNGLKGNIIYKCESRNWKSIENNCVLEVIDKLTSTVESLLVEEIPVFMANLSNATEQHNINITQSPATVQAIVDILSTIANLSKSVFINKPVMEDFLKTVDIIISDNVSNTWSILENKTSIKLLRAIEDISDRLTENGEIYKTSIQLIRATVTNSFNLTSSLPNSTTEIVIPQVPRATNITIIIFTTLDNVLPTHGSNDSRKSDVRINGDVVVVKVDNKMINNISFTFDITNQSLGNPQCVFWNFILDNWDSTGCEVKRNNIGNTTCECNHTTSFSILMSPFHIDPSHRTALAYITYIGVAISIASLIICLIIEIIVWKSMTRNDTSYMRHVSIVNIAVSLLIANICFIIGAAIAEQEQPTLVGRCSPAVFFMHFFYLALFFWMLMSALLLFYRTVMVLSQMSRAKMMAIAFIVGYGAPLLIAAITVASTAGQENYISKRDACWLNWYESKALLAFVIPALTIVAINLVVLAVVLYKILRRGVGAATQPDEKHALVVIARCVAILTPIFGLTWGFGIGTMVSQKQGIHVVFALLNSLQGFFILVFGTLLDSKVRESLPGKLLLQKLTSSRTNNTSAGTLSTSGLPFLRRWRNVYNVSEANPSSALPSSDSSIGSYAALNN
uniref:Adhesion G protein-coupled receptor F8 n=1 Tax=Cyprinus carpio carpio TaxID=630221 RepID=A0A9J7ZSB2_CYPCA